MGEHERERDLIKVGTKKSEHNEKTKNQEPL